MALRFQRRAERIEAAFERLDTAGVQCAKVFLARSHMQGSSMLRAGFGEGQHTVIELKGSQRAFAGNPARSFLPVKPARDLEMQHEPESPFQADGDLLADAPYLANGPAESVAQRRNCGAEQKRPFHEDADQLVSGQPLAQRFDIYGYVRQFGHRCCDSRTLALRQPIAARRNHDNLGPASNALQTGAWR